MTAYQNESKLVSIFVQGTLYGAFFVMFILTYWTLVPRRPPGRPLNKAMLAVSLTLFVLATIHMIINLIRILQAFVGQRDRTKSYWDKLSEPTHIIGTTIYLVQTLVGDGVALYRCWVVWGRRQAHIVLPSVFFLGSIVTGIGTLVSFSKNNNASIFTHRIWLISFFSFTLAASTTCTVMIATRIWFFNRKTMGDRPGGSLFPIMRIVLESGAIYSGALVVLLVLLTLKSWFLFVLVDSIPPIIGLVFSIIIVRVGLGITTDGPSPPTDSFVDNNHLKTINTIPRPPRSTSRISRRSIAFSQPHFWPVQPARPLIQPQHQRRLIRKTSIFSFKGSSHGLPGRDQGHYSLRSQMAHPTSYFRASGEIGVDLEVNGEIEEVRYKQPKALPVALMLPRSDHSFSQ